MASTNKYFAVKEETTPGTVVAPFDDSGSGAKFIDPVSVNVTPAREPILEATIRRRMMVEREDGIVRETGTVDLLADPNEIGYFLKWFFGSVSTTAAGDALAWKHTFTPQDSVITWTAEDYTGQTTQARRWTDMFGKTLKIEGRPKEAVTLSFDVTASKHTLVTNMTPADSKFSTAKLLAGYQAVVKINDTQETRAESFSFTFDNMVDEDAYLLGSQFYDSSADGPRIQGFSVKYDMELFFKNQTQHKRYLDDTTASPTAYGTALTGSNVKVTVTGRTTPSASPGFQNYQLEVEVHDTIFENSETRHERQNRIIQRVSGTGIYHAGATTACTVRLINTLSSL